MKKIDAITYGMEPSRYTVVSGRTAGAPRCSAGNILTWIGYDLKDKVYVRFTKSVFLKLVRAQENIIS